MVGSRMRMGTEVIPGGGLSRTGRDVEWRRGVARSEVATGERWMGCESWSGGPELAEMERERPTEMPRNGLGMREPARALVLVLGDPPSPLHHVPADEATKRGAIFWLPVCTADLASVQYVLYLRGARCGLGRC
jgi:hypothetical protein